MIKPPLLDSRDARTLYLQIRDLAKTYLPTWNGLDSDNDPAAALLPIFSRLLEILLIRLNRLPLKHFMEFLDFTGVRRYPGSPAEVPVTFKILPGRNDTRIPERTQVATVQKDNHPAVIFETRAAFDATPALLKRLLYVDPSNDRYAEYSNIENPPSPELLASPQTGIQLFTNAPAHTQIAHFLYLESELLFGRKELTTITIVIHFDGAAGSSFNTDSLAWEKPGEENGIWEPIDVRYLPGGPDEIRVVLESFESVPEQEIGGVKGFWIRVFPKLTITTKNSVSAIDGISAFLSPGTGLESSSLVDMLISNKTVLDATKPVYPFGEFPKYSDAIYIRSDKAFSTEVKEVKLVLKVNQPSIAELSSRFSDLVENTTITTLIEWQYPGPDAWKRLALFRHTFTITISPIVTITEKREVYDEIAGTFKAITGEDGTMFDFSGSGESGFQFTLPGDFTISKVNGEEGGWIRALVKSHDPYGKAAQIVPNPTITGPTSPPFVVNGSTLIPPIIESFVLTYTYKTTPFVFTVCLLEENFVFTNITEHISTGKPYTLFHSPDKREIGHDASGNATGADYFFSAQPALYIGLNRDFENRFMSLFFHILEMPFAVGSPTELGNPQIVWEAYGANEKWVPLKSNDQTVNLAGSGTVSFLSPEKGTRINPFSRTSLYPSWSEPLFWIRARLAQGTYTLPPFFRGLYLNTIMADQIRTETTDTVLGCGNGRRNQKVKLLKKPLLYGQIWVREPESPGAIAQDSLEKDHRIFNNENLRLPLTEGVAGSSETWVHWVEVPNFLTSASDSRHYTIDPVEGVITFGDTVHGMLPPALKNNIVLRHAQTGGGEQAKKAGRALGVKDLRSHLPFVESVYNVLDVTGGSDGWSSEDIQTFGPQQIKNRGKAVTTEDYEWLTLQRFSELARVRCLPTKAPSGGTLIFRPGAVTMLVLPDTPVAEPRPSKALLRRIEEYLKSITLANIGDELYAIGPAFVPISLTVHARAVNRNESKQVEGRIRDEINRFLHPHTGGENGSGWPFGRDVPRSELMAVLQGLEGVAFIQSLDFDESSDRNTRPIPEYSLPVSGTHTIIMIGA